MARLIFWFEFASTYSYLAASRIEAFAADAGVDLIWRPFLLGPIFQAQGWATSPFNIYPSRGAYMWRDMDRQAQKYGLPQVRRPDPFPQNGLLAARIATIGSDQPWGAEFSRAVYHAEFAEGRSIDDPALLMFLLGAAGQDGAALVAQAKTDQTIKDRLRAATEEAQALGVFGAPSFTTEMGEVFWGDDRLEDALNAARVCAAV